MNKMENERFINPDFDPCEGTHGGAKMLIDEYKKLAKNELPDLWKRIEAGITEKPLPTLSEKTGDKVIKTVNDIDFPVDDLKTVKLEPISYQNRYRFVRRYGGLLAACLCLAVLIPIIYFNRDVANQFAANDSAGAPAPAAAPAEDTATRSETAAGAVADDAGGILNDMVAEAVFSEAEAKKELAPAPNYDVENAEEADHQFGYDQEEPYHNASGEAFGNQVFRIDSPEKTFEISKVTVEITELSAAGFDADNVYTAVIIADETETLFTGTSIFLRENENLAAEIVVGETYLADLFYQEAAPYFTIMKIY